MGHSSGSCFFWQKMQLKEAAFFIFSFEKSIWHRLEVTMVLVKAFRFLLHFVHSMDDSKDPKEKPSSKKRILETSSDLKKALEAWDNLSQQAPKPAADEQMLSEVKDLLKQLKSQIEELK